MVENMFYYFRFVFLVYAWYLVVICESQQQECGVSNCTSVHHNTCEWVCCKGWMKDNQGKCSIRLPDNYEEPTINGCPKHGERIPVTISKDQNIGILPNPFTAYDWEGERLHVWLQKQLFKHCLCNNTHQNVTAISEKDEFGNTAVCHFIVVTVDDTKPVINNCPRDQKKTDQDNITWKSPTVHDNVGVRAILGPDPVLNNTRFKPGVYRMTYNATDWAGNVAKCTFHITVLNTGETLDVDAAKTNEILMLSATIIGSLLIIIGVSATAVFRLCRKRNQLRRLRRQSYQAPIPTVRPQATTDNHVYNVYDNDPPPYEIVVSDKLPEYSPPIKPPSYDEIGIQQSQSEKSSSHSNNEFISSTDRNDGMSNSNNVTSNLSGTSNSTADHLDCRSGDNRIRPNNRCIYSQSRQETNV